MQWMILPLRRYAEFSGRSQRKEYWMFTLLMAIIYVVGAALFFASAEFAGASGQAGRSAANTVLGVLAVVVILALLVPSIAVQVRRLHDQDKSGWYILLNLVPYVGGIIVMVLMCLPGTRGPNSYGDDPKDPLSHLTDTFS